MKTLESIQNELRDLVPQGTDLVLAAFKKILRLGSKTFNDYLAIEGRYQDVGRQLLQGTISNEDATLEFNKIRQSIIDFIGTLQENDIPELAQASEQAGGMADVYNGEVLYRIPKKMAVGVEVECIVRLAYDRKLLIQDFEVQVGDVMKDLRIANVMGVELLDPASDKAFEITTVYDTVQIVEKDLVTEWIFGVTPLKEGHYPLVLKISIIEMVDGIERKRNEVLKEQVEILLTVDPNDLGTEFQKGFTWQLSNSAEQRAVPSDGGKGIPESPHAPNPAAPTPPQPAPSKASKAVGLGLIGKVIAGIAFLVIGGVAVKEYILPNNLSPAEVAANERVSAFKDLRSNPDKNKLEDFVEANIGTDEAASAMTVLDSLENATWQATLASNEYASYQNYLDKYPSGKYADLAAAHMDEINRGQIVLVDSSQIVEPVTVPTETGGTTKPDKKPIAPKKTTPKTKKKPETKVAPVPTPTNPNTTDTKPEVEKPAPADPNVPVNLVSAARRPVYKKCDNSNKEKEVKCTEEKVLNYLKSRIQYPQEALDRGIQGRVIVSFVVERDGSITEVKALNDIGGGCGREAVRLVKSLPKFKPGLNAKGEPIRVKYTQPVTFKLR